jgi:hypothetical protein
LDLPWVKLLWSKYYRNGEVPNQSPNGSFRWRSILKLLNSFKGIAQTQIGSGDILLFSQDMWSGRVLQLTFPHLFLCNKEGHHSGIGTGIE